MVHVWILAVWTEYRYKSYREGKKEISILESCFFLLIRLLLISATQWLQVGPKFCTFTVVLGVGYCKNIQVFLLSKKCVLSFFSFPENRKDRVPELLLQALYARPLSSTTGQHHRGKTQQGYWILARFMCACVLAFFKYKIKMNTQVYRVAYCLYSSIRWLSNVPVAGLDSGVADILCWAPHLPHQELHHQQGHSEEGIGAHCLSACFPGTMWVTCIPNEVFIFLVPVNPDKIMHHVIYFKAPFE